LTLKEWEVTLNGSQFLKLDVTGDMRELAGADGGF
jgi:hypothetical protein